MNLSLGALLSNIVIKADIFDDPFTSRTQVMSADVFIMKKGGTVGEGPLIFGVSHSDLTVAEIAEVLNNDDFASRDNIISNERRTRPVRKWGVMPNITADEVVADGTHQRLRIKFAVGDQFNVSFWAQNLSGATLTTGISLRAMGTMYVRAIA